KSVAGLSPQPSRAESTTEPSPQSSRRRAEVIIRCQQMLHGVMAVTVAVMIVPLHTRYPPVVGVAWATEVKAPENPIWVAGERAGSIPARRPGT
ncbi:hypothetical protein Tco_1189778, partial [Tanacetum coccineum]